MNINISKISKGQIKRRKRERELIKDKINEIRELYDKGISLKEIANKFGYKGKSSFFQYVKDIRKTKQEKNVKEFTNKLNKLNEIDKSYIGGIVDGEGSLTLNKIGGGYLCPKVTIANNDLGIMNYIHLKIGINEKIIKRKTDGCFYWCIYGEEKNKLFLNTIKDYVKGNKTKEIINIVLKFIKDKKRSNKKFKYYNELKEVRGRFTFNGKDKIINHNEKDNP